MRRRGYRLRSGRCKARDPRRRRARTEKQDSLATVQVSKIAVPPTNGASMATAKRAAKSISDRATTAPPPTTAPSSFICPECGRTFARAAALGAHRSRVHGVAGSSASANSAARKRRPRLNAVSATRRPTQSRATRSTTNHSSARTESGVNRDALLAALFPNGMPAREAVIREVAAWLDHAERLSALR